MTEFSLDLLLKAIKLARWTYYYHLKQLDKTDKDQELKAEIQSIFIEHKGNYGYRRVHLELRNRGYLVNHKRVQGLMKVLNLQAKMRQKRKYSSHKGDVGKKAENLIQGQFEGSKTMEKCYTDVTEFAFQQVLKSFTYPQFLNGFNAKFLLLNLFCSS
ncbi:IS3-Spn1, transposase, partial [Streptococcus pneumoniae SP9-BS68]